jgi:hypothetical protein
MNYVFMSDINDKYVLAAGTIHNVKNKILSLNEIT